MPFLRLRLREPLLRALREEGYAAPTPIQAEAIPHVLEGRDVLALAQTGTGKTAAFVLPILERMASVPLPPGRRRVRVLVLAPTRELAAQVGESFAAYGRHLPFRRAVVFGGVGYGPQVDALARGADIVVATPGRLLDLLHRRRADLSHVEVLVLDEADRMLDMGFLPDVRRVLDALPRRRQTLFFSATMPREAQALADRILTDPVRVAVAPPATTVESVAQSVFFVDKPDKARLLEHLLSDASIPRALVFTRTKHGADKLAKTLVRAGIDADAIHGNKSQGRREKTLGSFRAGDTRVLVATDIAARGLDVEGITHVVNYDLPNVPESYVHRIGRTARAGAPGTALSFCDASEEPFLREIEKTTRIRLGVVEDHPFPRSRTVAPPPGRRPPHRAGHARFGSGPRHGRARRRHR
jgi:ATP-dependent RNA helicase RhlE